MLARGRVKFFRHGQRRTLVLVLTKACRRAIAKLAATNRRRAKHHQHQFKLRVSLSDRFTNRIGKRSTARTVRRSIVLVPGKRALPRQRFHMRRHRAKA